MKNEKGKSMTTDNKVKTKEKAEELAAAEVEAHKEPKTTPMTIETIQKAVEKYTETDKAENLNKVIDAFLLGHKLTEKLKPEQIQLCKQTALAFGLNPLKREIHFVPREVKRKNAQGYWEKTGEYDVNIVIGYEVYLKQAERTGKLNGWSITFEKDGTDQKAVITIHKKGWEQPFKHEVYLSEARQQTPTWDKMWRMMLRKTVIGQGFRLCFPDEMAGMPYLPEEIGAGVIEGGEYQEDKHPEPLPPPPPPKADKSQIDTLRMLLKQKGKSEQTLLDHFKIKTLEEMTKANADGTIKKLVTFPDKDEGLEPETESPSEDVDPEEIERGIAEQKAQEGQVS